MINSIIPITRKTLDVVGLSFLKKMYDNTKEAIGKINAIIDNMYINPSAVIRQI